MTSGVALSASSARTTTWRSTWLVSNTSPHTTTNSHPSATASAPMAPDGLEPGRGEPGLRLGAEEVAGHAELPIGTVEEPGHAPDSTEGV